MLPTKQEALSKNKEGNALVRRNGGNAPTIKGWGKYSETKNMYYLPQKER